MGRARVLVGHAAADTGAAAQRGRAAGSKDGAAIRSRLPHCTALRSPPLRSGSCCRERHRSLSATAATAAPASDPMRGAVSSAPPPSSSPESGRVRAHLQLWQCCAKRELHGAWSGGGECPQVGSATMARTRAHPSRCMPVWGRCRCACDPPLTPTLFGVPGDRQAACQATVRVRTGRSRRDRARWRRASIRSRWFAGQRPLRPARKAMGVCATAARCAHGSAVWC